MRIFDVKDINKTAAVLDLDKLDWMNNQYLKKEDPEKLADQLIPLLKEKGYLEDNFDRNYLVSLVKLFQARLTLLNDFPDWADFFFLKEITPEPKAAEKYLSRDFSEEFKLFIQRLEALEPFSVENIEGCFRGMVAELKIEAKVLVHPVRVALTGKTVGPGLFEVIYYLGKARTKQRLMRWIR
jgi:glutamyl/glutaminyl-tRNA synthetase